jgi:2-keto-4-pentenoate hydratase/2-oxohepta-3-ene-1,7-dioic acid hydratase in catechol pathway
MKIICVGRNYAKHIEELNNERPESPVIFLKPDSSRLKNGKPFFYPEHSSDIHYEAELVLRVSKNGKHIQSQFAKDYINEITVGIDFTARDTQSSLKSKGLPWELAKAFDDSAAIGDFQPLGDYNSIDNINFSLEKNGNEVQSGNSSLMLFPVFDLIAFVSKYFSLKQGDLIFTGTPAGVGPIAIGDEFVGKLEGKEVLKTRVK